MPQQPYGITDERAIRETLKELLDELDQDWQQLLVAKRMQRIPDPEIEPALARIERLRRHLINAIASIMPRAIPDGAGNLIAE